MKVKYKLLVTMIAISMILIFFNCFFMLRVTRREFEEEKCALYREVSEQVLLSFAYTSDDVESNLFDSCKAEGIGSIMMLEKSYQSKLVQLQLKLSNIIGSNSYFSDAFFVDLEKNYFFSTQVNANERNNLEKDYEELFLDYDRDILWAMSENGDLYLRRAVYNFAPYKKVAYMVASIDKEYLRGLIGIDTSYGGTMCVLDYKNMEIISNEPNEYDLPGFAEQASDLQDQWANVECTNGDTIYLHKISTDRRDWNILYIIPQSVVMEEYSNIQKTTFIVGAMLMLIAVILALTFSKTLTNNITSLITSIKMIHDGAMDMQIEVNGHDEIAEVAQSFNWLLEYVNDTYLAILEETSAKQQAKYELLELKYRSIQSQISPHFISNILSAICSFSVMGQAEKMERLCITASRYLRNNLANNDKRFNTVGDEITTVDEYIDIYRMMYPAHFEYECFCPVNLRSESIPCMLLQPLVENSLVHGMVLGGEQTPIISILVEEDGDWMVIKIKDNGQGMDKQVLQEIEYLKNETSYINAHSGFGMGSVLKRLRLQYGSEYLFDITSEPNNGTEIKIGIPRNYSQKHGRLQG